MESSPNDGKEEKIGGKESDGVENERGNPHMKKKGFPQGFIFPHTITHLWPLGVFFQFYQSHRLRQVKLEEKIPEAKGASLTNFIPHIQGNQKGIEISGAKRVLAWRYGKVTVFFISLTSILHLPSFLSFQHIFGKAWRREVRKDDEKEVDFPIHTPGSLSATTFQINLGFNRWQAMFCPFLVACL